MYIMNERLAAALTEGAWIAVLWNTKHDAIGWREVGSGEIVYAEDYDEEI